MRIEAALHGAKVNGGQNEPINPEEKFSAKDDALVAAAAAERIRKGRNG